MKGHEEVVGIPAAVIAAVAPYIETLSIIGQLLAVWIGCGVALVTLAIKIRQWRRGK